MKKKIQKKKKKNILRISNQMTCSLVFDDNKMLLFPLKFDQVTINKAPMIKTPPKASLEFNVSPRARYENVTVKKTCRHHDAVTKDELTCMLHHVIKTQHRAEVTKIAYNRQIITSFDSM